MRPSSSYPAWIRRSRPAPSIPAIFCLAGRKNPCQFGIPGDLEQALSPPKRQGDHLRIPPAMGSDPNPDLEHAIGFRTPILFPSCCVKNFWKTQSFPAIFCLAGRKMLKVIIETCILTREEKVEMCRIVTQAGADFIKTSTRRPGAASGRLPGKGQRHAGADGPCGSVTPQPPNSRKNSRPISW